MKSLAFLSLAAKQEQLDYSGLGIVQLFLLPALAVLKPGLSMRVWKIIAEAVLKADKNGNLFRHIFYPKKPSLLFLSKFF